MADADVNGTTSTTDDERSRKEAAAPAWLAGTLDNNGFPADMTPEEKRAAASIPDGPAVVAGPNGPAESAAAPAVIPRPVEHPTAAPTPMAPPLIAGPNSAQPRAVGVPTLARPEDATAEIAPGTAPGEIGRPVAGASGAYVLPGHAVGTPATENGVAPPIHPAVPWFANLWTKEKNIDNPFLRVLARVGTGILEGADVAGEGMFPRFAAITPGSILNTEIRNRQAEGKADRATQLGIEQQNADTARMGETAKANAPAKPFTLSEAQGQAYQDLLRGNNGQPRVNPATQKPYTEQEALQEVQKPPASPKETPHYVTDRGTGNVVALTPDGKGGSSAKIVYKGNPKVPTEIRQRPTAGGGVEDVLWNKQTGELIKVLGPGVKPGIPTPLAGDTAKNGADYLATLPAADRSLVEEIGTGKMPLGRLSYIATRNPQLLEEVAQAYPDFDASKVESYPKTYADFTSGKTAAALNSAGTALVHLQNLRKINDANPVEVRIPGTAANLKYNNLLNTVAEELTKFYRASGGTEEDIKNAKSTLGSLANRDAAIEEQANAMGVKLDQYRQQWDNAAPSKAYQAPMPYISQQALRARASLDPDFAAEHPELLRGAGGAGARSPQGGSAGEPVRFSVNGKIYNIPADKVDAFKKQFPKAEQQ